MNTLIDDVILSKLQIKLLVYQQWFQDLDTETQLTILDTTEEMFTEYFRELFNKIGEHNGNAH